MESYLFEHANMFLQQKVLWNILETCLDDWKCFYSISVAPWKMAQMYAHLFKSYRKNMFMKSKYGSISGLCRRP